MDEAFEGRAIINKLGAFVALRPEETIMLARMQGPRTRMPKGVDVVYEGQQQHGAYVLHEGWACSYKRLRDGGRQIIDIQIPGDFLGLRSLLLRTSDHSFVTLTDVEVSKISTQGIWEMFRSAPRLALALLWAASRDEAMVVEHLVSIGRRDPLARTAHFLLELGTRMNLVGLGSAHSYECPLSQSVLADALGITAIHLNRVLRQLREADLLVLKGGIVTFVDKGRLAELTGFDIGYLDHDTPILKL
ncbi:Crp/Fnr family transcriptional regulator [Mesorhizobium sp. BAC0120]|uniref:Crp/Fnr family transcriptional regulator n=1 Tax=Mesorhizobium sp. BAC0120 TaxID=3090670 RepID=UPI00298CDA90|nr:Crp/Fnr family transcriptional regulator [Mesorhizobium sp. BAC0120]MDW6026658.1 Crp/Fnr family transcriptional regulator [Mesorhizobium sp. BAC0120]